MKNAGNIPKEIVKRVHSADFIIKGEVIKVGPAVTMHVRRQFVVYRAKEIYKGKLSPGVDIKVDYFFSNDMEYLEPGVEPAMLSKTIFKPGNNFYVMLRGKINPTIVGFHQAYGTN